VELILRDRAYRRALGLDLTGELPKTLGTISGSGSRLGKPRGARVTAVNTRKV
jgi:hypothetical protein